MVMFTFSPKSPVTSKMVFKGSLRRILSEIFFSFLLAYPSKADFTLRMHYRLDILKGGLHLNLNEI